MKATDFLTALIHFFNDLVAHIVPGLLLVISIAYAFEKFDSDGFKSVHWAIHLAIYYILGHFLLALHNELHRFLSWLKFTKTSEIVTNLKTDPTYIEFKKVIKVLKSDIDFSNFSFNDARSIAMSSDTEACELAQRFMFISLFCKGVSTALLVICLGSWMAIANYLDSDCYPILYNSLITVALLITVYLFNNRVIEFEKRALRTPFSIALSKRVIFCETLANEPKNDQ